MSNRPKLVKPPVLENISSPRVFYVHEWWNGYVRTLSELHKKWALEDERATTDRTEKNAVWKLLEESNDVVD